MAGAEQEGAPIKCVLCLCLSTHTHGELALVIYISARVPRQAAAAVYVQCTPVVVSLFPRTKKVKRSYTVVRVLATRVAPCTYSGTSRTFSALAESPARGTEQGKKVDLKALPRSGFSYDYSSDLQYKTVRRNASYIPNWQFWLLDPVSVTIRTEKIKSKLEVYFLTSSLGPKLTFLLQKSDVSQSSRRFTAAMTKLMTRGDVRCAYSEME